jgi:hypothetical protein
MFQDDKKLREKRIIAIKKQLDILRNKQYSEWIILDKPIHKGYDVLWVLRDDILNRDDVDYIQHALDLFNFPSWHRNIKSGKKEINNPWSINDKNYHWNLGKLYSRYISKEKYDNLSFNVQKFLCTSYVAKKNIYVYVLDIPKYWLIPKMIKCWVSQVRDIVPEVIAEIAELEEELYNLDPFHWWGNSIPKSWRKIKNKQFRANTRNLLAVENYDKLNNKKTNDYW